MIKIYSEDFLANFLYRIKLKKFVTDEVSPCKLQLSQNISFSAAAITMFVLDVC